MRETLQRLVENKLQQWKISQIESPIVLGISGGVDSMVLLHVLYLISQKENYQSVRWVVAHFNHGLRQTSDRDMNLVKDFAENLNLPYYVEYWQHPSQINVEAEAREARYQFLARVAKSEHAHTLMTAHHLNDQAETHLMRLIRGTSLKGWNGISESFDRTIRLNQEQSINLTILRPLLSISKDEIYRYAEDEQVPYHEDETNHSDDYLRNRIRHHMIPLLQAENPQFMSHLEQMLTHLNLSYQAHYDQFLLIEPKLVSPNFEGGWTLDLEEWWKLSQASQSIYLKILFEERIVNKMGHYSQMMIEQLETLCGRFASPNAQLDLGSDWQAIRAYRWLKIIPSISSRRINNAFELIIDNQWHKISEDEFVGIFEQTSVTQQVEMGQTLVYHLNLESIESASFVIRHRQPGDYMTISQDKGQDFTKKIRRLFIDEKLSLAERDQTWLVTSDEHHVIWAVGLRKGQFQPIENEHQITHSILYQKRKN